MVENIINEYLNDKVSIEKLALKYKMGKIKIKQILSENNIELKQRGGQQKHITVPFKYDLINKMVECKSCGKTYNDVENKSGILVEHINECFPEIIIPNKLFRSNYKKNNGEFWHFKYFNLIEKENKETLKCPECDWCTTDLTNKTGSFTKHVIKEHDSVEDFVLRNKNYEYLFNVYKKNTILSDFFNNSDDNFIICKICGEIFKTITNTHLNTHETNINDYKIKFGEYSLISNTSKKTFVDNLTNCVTNIKYRSKGEIDICEFLQSNNINVDICNKKILNGIELDMYLPDYKIAIEYNGLFWHSEKQGKNKTYHINKTKKCLEKNIRLIHIFSDEWITKHKIIKNRLLNLTNKNNVKYYARKCIVSELTKEEKGRYLTENHLQGNDKSQIFIGLKFNNKIVAVMTFGSLRKSMGYKNVQNFYELYRYSSLNVIGGFSKMFKYFIKKYDPEKVITYANRNWTPSDDFSFYNKVGFSFVSETEPNYSYTKKYDKREHRFNYTKNKLIKMGFDKNKSESEIMFENGYDRIWDCGNLKYEYKKRG